MVKLKSKLPVSRMLTISTAHVTQDTFEALALDGVRNEILLPVYSKTAPGNGENYGLFVYMVPELIVWDRIPKDFVPVVKFCLENDCHVLCLDSDGIHLNELPIYEWEG